MKLHSTFVAGLMLFAGSAMAIPLLPGGHVGRDNPDAPGLLTVFSDSPNLVASSTGTYSNLSISGSVTSAVFLNDLGTLDFFVQVTVDPGSDPIHRITLYNFGLWSTDVGYRIDAYNPFLVPGTIFASEANRSTSGSVVGFDFDLGANGLNPGATSYTLVVRTDATQYTKGNVGIINGVTANIDGYAPVPEPATLTALGIGALALMRRRRR